MPLSSTGEPGLRELYGNNVYFFMTYRGHRIRCGITDVALEVLEPKLDRTGRGWLIVFNTGGMTSPKPPTLRPQKRIRVSDQSEP